MGPAIDGPAAYGPQDRMNVLQHLTQRGQIRTRQFFKLLASVKAGEASAPDIDKAIADLNDDATFWDDWEQQSGVGILAKPSDSTMSSVLTLKQVAFDAAVTAQSTHQDRPPPRISALNGWGPLPHPLLSVAAALGHLQRRRGVEAGAWRRG